MAIKASDIKDLREQTGAGVMECKKALEEAEGDVTKAAEILRLMSAATATKKSGRATKQGRIESYIHGPGRIGVLVELNCESDFVANSDEFQQLARDICMQVAASSPAAVSREEVPEDIIAFHKDKFKGDVEGKPPQIVEKILEGKLNALFKELVLLEQPYIKEPKVSVQEYLQTQIGKLKENITVKRFVRWQLGD